MARGGAGADGGARRGPVPALLPAFAVQAGPAPDWAALGLILAIVGCFLLANGLLFRHPRALVEMRFSRRPMALRTIRELIFHRVQLALGFLFLLAGFAVQLYARSLPPPGEGAEAGGSTALWIGALVLLAIGLEVLGWWWSLWSFRRHVRAWLREHPPDLETDTHLARELGELFAVASHADDTVQTYVARVRKQVGLAPALRRPREDVREPVLPADELA